MLCFLAALSVFYVALNVPNYHWYYAPYYAFGCMYAGLGVAWLYDAARKLKAPGPAPFVRAGASLLAVGLLSWSAFATHARPVSESKRQREYPLIGKWLAQNTPPDATIAMVEVGIIGYYCERRVVDILGLVSPGNSAALGERRFADWLLRYEPDLVLVHNPPWPHEMGVVDHVKRGDYRVHAPFRFPGYVLLARNG